MGIAAECSAIKHKAKIPHLPLQQVSLSTPYERITRNVDEEILKLKVGNSAEEYLQRRWKIDDKQMKKVLWSDIRSVIKRVPNHRKTQYSKILHKTWPTMKRNHEWKFSVTPNCPICVQQVEDRMHIFRCDDPIAVSHRNVSLLKLKTKMAKAFTNPFITNHILRVLRQYHGNFTVTEIKKHPNEPQQHADVDSFNSFIKIGADNIISGEVSSDLSEIQERYAKEFDVEKNSRFYLGTE